MHNKKFSLVLGGGAARGLAHIGVIRRLEELWVVPQSIAGTSMWAVIWAFYACGYTSKELEVIASDVNLMRLVDIDIKRWWLKWKKIENFLEQYFGEKTFWDTRIPLTIIATDLNTGMPVVFRDWKIIDAIRASISISWVFTPYEYNNTYLIDWWIVANLPVEYTTVGIWVIAVSVQIYGNIPKKEPILPFIGNGPFARTYDTLRKTIQIIMQRNEEKSILSRKDVLILRIGRNDIDYYEFKKVWELISEWYHVSSVISSYL